MKNRLLKNATICLLFLMGIAGCGQKPEAGQDQNSQQDSQPPDQGNGAAPGAPHVDASQSPIADPSSPLYGWEKFSSAEGKFSAMFPTRPKEEDKTEPGRPGAAHIFESESDPNNVYAAGYYDYAQIGDPKLVLAKIEETMVKRRNGKIVFYKAMEVDNYPATEFEFVLGDKPNYSYRVRLILAGQRVYDLTVAFLTAQPHPDKCDAFFNSFSLQSN